MAESKQSTSAASKAAAASPPRVLAPAGESGDPAVHQLIAELDIVRRNGDDTQAEALVKRLADLGFSA